MHEITHVWKLQLVRGWSLFVSFRLHSQVHVVHWCTLSLLRPWCCSRSVSLAMQPSSLMQSWRASATCPCLPSCLWCLWLVSLPPLALPRSWSQKCSHLTTWVQQDSLTIGPRQPGLWPCPSLPSLWLLSTCWSRWMVSRRTSERPGFYYASQSSTLPEQPW